MGHVLHDTTTEFLLDKLVYLDNATTSWPKPDEVYDFMFDFYRNNGVSPGRGASDKAVQVGNIIEELRLNLTRFFGGDESTPERLVFGYNVTDALNLVIQGILSQGDHVVTTNLEHNAVIRPINHFVRDVGGESTFVPFDADGFVQPDDIRKAIKSNTKLVVVNHGSNVLGTVQPIGEIGRICREHGVPLVIDTSQTAGVIPIDMTAMNIDIVTFTGHKSLMGSTGIGGLCVRDGVEIRPTRSGGTGIESAYPYQLEEYPYRLEYGTPNMVGIASLSKALEWIHEQGGEVSIHNREMQLFRRLLDGLKQIEGVIAYCCDNLENHLAVLSMNIEGIEADNVGAMLDAEHNVATRAGLHCAPLVHEQIGTVDFNGAVRFGIGPFNTEEDIDHAIRAIGHIAEHARGNHVGAQSSGK